MNADPQPAPPTNLSATWNAAVAGATPPEGITLSWTAPADMTVPVGGYYVYVLCENTVLGAVDEVLFASLSATQTTCFFPVAWMPPPGSVYALPTSEQANGEYLTMAFSFHIYSVGVNDPDAISTLTSITAFKPPVNDQPAITHLNPLFSINGLSVQNGKLVFSGGNGAAATLLQDTYEEVASCVQMVLSTPLGLRTQLPNFGVEDPTFTEVNANLLETAIRLWEPRAAISVTVTNDDSATSPAGGGADTATVQVDIISIEKTAI